MAESSPVPTNIRDMIELIASDKVQEELFTLHAPHLKVKWAELPSIAKRRRRAEMLAGYLKDYMASRGGKDEGTELFSQLNTIAVINADPSSGSAIEEMIEKHQYLKKRLQDPEWWCIPIKGPAILASFINIIAHRAIKESGDPMADAHERTAKREASKAWESLIASATNQLNHIQRTKRFNISDPKITDKAARAAGIDTFSKELKKLMRDKRSQEKFYVAVEPMPYGNQMRYLVKTSPMPGEVAIVTKDHSDSTIDQNRHVIAFEILHDEVHNRICISLTTILPPMDILRLFMLYVIGCEFVQRERLSYEKSLQVFRGKAGSKVIKLAPEELANGDRAWIAALAISLDGNLLPTVYHGNDLQEIYEQMDGQIDPRRFPEDKRIVEAIDIKVELHDVREVDGGKKIPTSTSKTFTIKVGRGLFRVYGKDKCFNKRWLRILERLKHDWGFDGYRLEQAKAETSNPMDLFM